jgi:PAS domain-containing protein
LIASGWLRLVHPDDATSTLKAWQDCLDGGIPYDSVHRFRGADNTYRWFQCKGTPVRDAHGEIVNWYGLSTDIHERQLVQETLRKEELNLRRLVDALPAMIWRATPQGHVDRRNLQMLTFMGQSGEEFDKEMLLRRIPEADRPPVHSRWKQAVQEGAHSIAHPAIHANGIFDGGRNNIYRCARPRHYMFMLSRPRQGARSQSSTSVEPQ